MDPIAIILTIAACIGGLLLLGGIAYAIVASVVVRHAKKSFESFRL